LGAAVIVRDISESKEAEQRYRATFDNAPVGIMHTAIENDRILRANAKLCEMLGYTQRELTQMLTDQFVHPDQVGTDQPKYREAMLKGDIDTFSSERAYRRKDGSDLWVNRTVSLVRDAAGKPLYFIRIVEDITVRKQAETRQAMEHAVTRVLTDAGTLGEAIPKIVQTICETLHWHCGARWARDDENGTIRCYECWGVDSPEIQEFMTANTQRAVVWDGTGGEGLVRRAVNTAKPVWVADLSQAGGFRRASLVARARLRGAFCFPLLVGNEVLGVMEFFHRDVRPPDDMLIQAAESIGRQIGQYIVRKQAEERVQHLAHFDGLTGLPNRTMFNERLNHALTHARRNERSLAVLFIDLDRFKNINDTLGHDAGDHVLREIARRLRGCLRESDTVGRLGGDEFVVQVEEPPRPLNAAVVAQKLLDATSMPFVVQGQEFHITASIGISTYPDDGADLQTLMKNADIAMYRAKEHGKNNFQFYSAQFNVHSLERLTLESNLRRALARDEFLLHYQPIMDVRSGLITGVEALLRWQEPALGLIPPAQFIQLAEETGLIVPIGEWVLKTACARNKAWQDRGWAPVRIAVNLSPRQFAHEDLLQDVARVLKETGMDPRLLDLEITEGVVMRNPEQAVGLLTRLKALGIHVSIDDFGTGYSSLNYLKRFPLDTLKIDRTFISDLPGNQDDAAITRAIVAMAHSLRLRVVAEGVETAEQLNFLRDCDCDEVQGYYFSRPRAERDIGPPAPGQRPRRQRSFLARFGPRRPIRLSRRSNGTETLVLAIRNLCKSYRRRASAPGAARGDARSSAGRVRRADGRIRRRQVHLAESHRGTRRARRRQHLSRRRNGDLAGRRGTNAAPASAHRFRIPGLSPAASPHGGTKRRAAARVERRAGRSPRREGGADAGSGRARRRRRELSARALGRRDAARGHCPGAGSPAAVAARGRADGQPRPDAAAQVLALLREQVKRESSAGVLVTHSPLAAATADRVLTLTADGLKE
jgi:diguanylate cyclase (GGDEF)-like protein/PAS domain S-box-containing protein